MQVSKKQGFLLTLWRPSFNIRNARLATALEFWWWQSEKKWEWEGTSIKPVSNNWRKLASQERHWTVRTVMSSKIFVNISLKYLECKNSAVFSFHITLHGTSCFSTQSEIPSVLMFCKTYAYKYLSIDLVNVPSSEMATRSERNQKFF